MKFIRLSFRSVCLVLMSLGLFAPSFADQPSWHWPSITNLSRPWAYWWWMGSAVDEQNLDKVLQQYRQAGLGGLHVIPIYGTKGYEDKFIPFLSPQWVRMLESTITSAQKLDLGIDMTVGTGWPFGGSQVDETTASTRVIIETWNAPRGSKFRQSIHPKDSRIANYAIDALRAFDTAGNGNTFDLLPLLSSEQELTWNVPERNDYTIYAVFRAVVGQKVKRAAPGGEGLVLNPFDCFALQHYLARFDSAFSHTHIRPRAFYCDSYEVYGANWTKSFFEIFCQIKGYDLAYHLPELIASTISERSGRIKSDYRHVLSVLLYENFAAPWVDWCRRQGTLTRYEAHGSPGNLLDLYALSDSPETEIFGPSGFPIPGLRTDPDFPDPENKPDPLMLKFASSAAHVAGRPLVSSESCTWLGEHFRVAISQAKPEVDQLFCAGINHVFYHGITYSPVAEEWPGWLFYASTNFGPSNSFWRDLPALNDYIARCQAFLQQGQPDHDILLYFPLFDVWHTVPGLEYLFTVHKIKEWLYGSPFHQIAKLLWRRGFTFDYISDQQIGQLKVANDRLVSPGASFRALIIPETRYMPVETLEHLRRLSQAGGTIIFQNTFPGDVPGYADLTSRRRIFDATKAGLSKLGNSAQLVLTADLESALLQRGIQREAMADLGLQFERRHRDGRVIYFISNLTANPVDDWVPLARNPHAVVLFDPMTRQTGLAVKQNHPESACRIYLQLQPGQSVILQGFDKATGPDWFYHQPAGYGIPITGSWLLDFIAGGPVVPPSVRLDSLISWTARSDEEAKRFAGTGRYRIQFSIAKNLAENWLLDLGRVCESAQVFLNDQELGAIWCFPFQRLVGESLRDGANVLEIHVTNLSANRIADLDRRQVPWKKFYDINFVNIRYRPFDASEWPLMDSGLLGPVRLIPVRMWRP